MANDMSLRICSYNCRGYNDSKTYFVNLLLSEADILCIQEHWLTEEQLTKLGHINSDFLSNGVSGFDCSEVLSGRPYGGCAILWRSNVAAQVDVVPTDSRRIYAITVSSTTYKFLLINVYMPYEDDDGQTDLFVEELSRVEALIVNNSDCHVILTGDFNVDFSRERLHTALLRSFCENHDLSIGTSHVKSQIDYTYHFNMQKV
jgi:exonuclease III